jgi:outer membrane protein assembly factor BamB
VPVGDGVASPVVVGGRVFVFARHKDEEVVRCLDLPDGKEIWRSEPYPAPYRLGPGEGTADDRPRSTPAVAGGRVYALGMTGVLSCLDCGTGKVVWRKDCKPYLPYGANSPLVADGLCIVHVGDEKNGGLTAFDAVTGEVRWCYAEGSRPTSASPILVNLAGRRQVVTVTSWHLLGVSADTGKKLWGLNILSPGSLIVTPVRYKDLLMAAGDRQPPIALRVEEGPGGLIAREVWKANDVPLYMSTPVVAGDLLFGMAAHRRGGGSFFCLDAPTGKTLWEHDGGPRLGNAAILNVGSAILFLRNDGRLVVVKPSATAYEPLAEYTVDDTPPERGGPSTWAHPVFLGDRILVRDRTTLRCFRIVPDAGGP